MKKPTDRLHSFAVLIVYSIARDAPALGATPMPSTSPTPSGSSTNLAAADFVGHSDSLGSQSYLGGSKALDALAKLVQATESFFHPSNWGSWSLTLARFLQNVTWEFLKRWKVRIIHKSPDSHVLSLQQEEEKPDCTSPTEYRLTREIRREFVATMRTVALLSMYSKVRSGDVSMMAHGLSNLFRTPLLSRRRKRP
jgi:proteasome activator subunit 4